MFPINFYYSISFWLFFALIAVVSRFLGGPGKSRNLFLLLSSSAMILSLPGFTFVKFALLIFMVLITFCLATFLQRHPPAAHPGGRRLGAACGIIGVVFFLAVFKYRPVQQAVLGIFSPAGGQPASFVFMIGVSYLSFKMIHVLIESFRGNIENLTLLNYLTYIVFFPPFISGPINRYNHFAAQLAKPRAATISGDARAGGERIVHGLFKKFVLVQLLQPYILGSQNSFAAGHPLVQAVLGLYAYALYSYFDFSGYSDLAIGSSRILGLDLPENFNHPFLKKNIREFWMNWHMSLTSWLVDYIYWPVVRKLRNVEYFRKHSISLSNVGMIITFIVCGMWHGEAPHFILWGAYHGFGIAMVNVYQREKRKIANPALQRYFASRTSRAVGIFLTFSFFAAGLAFFVMDLAQVRAMIARILF